jgi:hypothetical protein
VKAATIRDELRAFLLAKFIGARLYGCGKTYGSPVEASPQSSAFIAELSQVQP